MKLLPDRTKLPEAPLERAHTPEEDDYTKYRDCLRWEFGFTCALCFLHEQDLAEGGVEGTALIWIEHHEPKGKATEKRDEYDNCLLSCRHCNNTRGRKPTIDPATNAAILDPTRHAWVERFYFDGDALKPRPGDVDAERTREAYRLDAQHKTDMRAYRAARFADFDRALNALTTKLPKLKAIALNEPEKAALLLEVAADYRHAIEVAASRIRRYTAIPVDAPNDCLCDEELQLPAWLAKQVQDLDVP